jgi:8-hydroxy-5-deazaflavin:NADPH oxidoreductase
MKNSSHFTSDQVSINQRCEDRRMRWHRESSALDSWPNTAFEPTPPRSEQDRVDFDSWFLLDHFADLSGRRGSMLAVGRRIKAVSLVSPLWRIYPKYNITLQSCVLDSALDVVLLATRWAGVRDALQAAGPLTDKVLIDCTLPIVNREKAIDGNTSGAEEIARLLPAAKVVKAFNTIHYEHFGARRFETMITAFYCGDDPAAKAITAELAADLGLEPVDAGPLFVAGMLEGMGLLYIYLSFVQGYGATIAFKLLREGSGT